MLVRLLFVLCLACAFWGASAQTVAECQPNGVAQANAPWYCDQINQAVANVWAGWAPIGFIAVMLSFLFAAMIFMASVIMRSEHIRRFAYGEFYEAAATAIMVVAFLSICAILFGIIPSFVTGLVNPYSLSLNYISSTIKATQAPIVSLYDVIMIDSYYASTSLEIDVGTSGVSKGLGTASSLINPLADFITQWFMIPATTMMALLLDGLLALTAEFYMILFFMYVAIPVFLVPGIIFRAILPLRSVGGMLMAIAISFYLVMPILFSVSYFMTNTSVIAQLGAANAAIVANGQGTGAQTNAASPGGPLVQAIGTLKGSMGAFFVSILFYPALILALTYFAMTTIADFIGGVAKTTGRLGLL